MPGGGTAFELKGNEQGGTVYSGEHGGFEDGSAIPESLKPGELSGVKYSDEWTQREVDLGAIGSDGRQVGQRLELLKKVAGDKFKEGKYTMACKMYTDAIRLSPSSHTLYSNRSAVYTAAREYIRAFEDACKCIDLAPAWAKGYARKGAALHGMDRWGEAIAAYQKGLDIEPGNAPLLQGIDDAKRRHMLAGGDWKFIGNRQVYDDKDGRTKPLLGNPTYLCAGPPGYFCYFDHERSMVRVANMAASYFKVTLNEHQETNRAGLFGPVGGVECSKDYVYVTDQMRCRVMQCSIVDGALLKTLGRSGYEDGNFDEPYGLALNGDTLFVCDSKNHRVVALDAKEMTFKYKFGRWGQGDGDLMSPRDIATFGNRILVADTGNQRLSLFQLDGTFLRHLGPDLECPMFPHETHYCAITDGACFCIEGPKNHEEKVPGRIHCLDPETGKRLRPPFQPPFCTGDKGAGLLRGVAVFQGSLFVASGAGIVMSLPREPAKEKAVTVS